MTSAVAKKLKEEHLIPEGTTAPPGLRWGGVARPTPTLTPPRTLALALALV